jgi:MFS family permease
MYRSLLLPVYLPSFLMSVCQGAALLLLPLYALDIGGSPAMAAIIFACRGLGNMLADVPAGLAAEKFGDARVMQVGVALMVLAAVGCAFASNLLHLGLFALIIGLSMATWLLARLTLISDLVAINFRGQALSTMAGLQRFGNFLGPLSTGYIVYEFGYTTAFMLIAALAGTTYVLLMTRATRSEGEAPGSPTAATSKAPQVRQDSSTNAAAHPIWQLLRAHRSILLTGGAVVFLLTLIRAARTLLLPLWGISLGLNAAQIGAIVGLAAGLDMLMFPVAGLIMDRLGRRPAGMSCLGLLSFGLLLLSFTSTPLTFTLAACVAGIGNGLGSGINMTLGTDFAPVQQRGHFLGVWRLIGDAGAFAGPTLISAITASVGLSMSILSASAFGFFGLLMMARFVPETLKKQAPRSQIKDPS